LKSRFSNWLIIIAILLVTASMLAVAKDKDKSQSSTADGAPFTVEQNSEVNDPQIRYMQAITALGAPPCSTATAQSQAAQQSFRSVQTKLCNDGTLENIVDPITKQADPTQWHCKPKPPAAQQPAPTQPPAK
jgi:hypothetical protein